MLSTDEKEKIRSFCASNSTIAAAYVFGSTATGKDRKKSDVDLAIMIKDPIDSMQRIEMENALSNVLRREVDLVIFNSGSHLLQHQILKYGQMIYEADPGERVRQEVFARKAYLDTAHLYRKLKRPETHG